MLNLSIFVNVHESCNIWQERLVDFIQETAHPSRFLRMRYVETDHHRCSQPWPILHLLSKNESYERRQYQYLHAVIWPISTQVSSNGRAVSLRFCALIRHPKVNMQLFEVSLAT